ncbi:MAG: transcription elongation factor GreA [Spirochaetota bacterium]
MSEEQKTAEHELVQTVTEQLNQEKWTRATLNNYTINNFKELDSLLERIVDEELEEQVLEACEEHLQHTKNSIIALYLSGILRLRHQAVDDSNIVMLINIFTDNHRWNIVEYLAFRILEFGENRFALRTLAECYNSENQREKMYEVWERLIRVDYEEADIVRHLAEKREENGELEEAVDYYKKALHRYINKKNFNNIKEIWHRLIQYAPDDIEFFDHAEGKIAKVVSEDRAVQLLEDLYPHYKKEGNWDRAIDILKRVLSYDSKNPWARKELVECYKEKYANHSHLDEYIRISNLNQSWRNVHDAIADFEKHISFDAGNFVFHRSWGVGIIRKIDGDSVVVDFAKKRGHKMSLKMAVNALDILPKDHIWVLRSIADSEKLHKKVKNNPEWALKTVIKSLGNAADMKKIKAELVPHVLSQREWSSWSTKARQILKTNKDFGNLTDKPDHFMVREQPITFAEKMYNQFRAEKDFFGRVKALDEFLEQFDYEGRQSTESDLFREMFDYFTGFLRSQTNVNENVVASYLVVNRIVERFPYLNPGIELDFNKLFEQISNLEEVFSRIDNKQLKGDFLDQVKRHITDWPEYFVRLFPYHLSRELIHELEARGYGDRLRDMFLNIYNNFRDMREPFVWIVRNCVSDEWYQALPIAHEKILIAMVHLLDTTAREIDNRRDVSVNRKLHRQIHTYLFKSGQLAEYIDHADEDGITRIFTLVNDVKDLDPSLVIELKHRILDRFPGFKFYGEAETETVNRGLIVTPASYDAKRKQLQHIHEVEVPENSQEIAEARSHGDLKENAEYKAAKERQDMLNNTAARLQEEIERAQIVRPKEVEGTAITFGTRVRLHNLDSDQSEEYTVLGPWESDPDQSIISYLSPLGSKLYNHKEGDELEFSINDRQYRYRVDNIEVASFS